MGIKQKQHIYGDTPKLPTRRSFGTAFLQQNAMDFGGSRCDPSVFDKCPIPRPRIKEVTHIFFHYFLCNIWPLARPNIQKNAGFSPQGPYSSLGWDGRIQLNFNPSISMIPHSIRIAAADSLQQESLNFLKIWTARAQVQAQKGKFSFIFLLFFGRQRGPKIRKKGRDPVGR